MLLKLEKSLEKVRNFVIHANEFFGAQQTAVHVTHFFVFFYSYLRRQLTRESPFLTEIERMCSIT